MDDEHLTQHRAAAALNAAAADSAAPRPQGSTPDVRPPSDDPEVPGADHDGPDDDAPHDAPHDAPDDEPGADHDDDLPDAGDPGDLVPDDAPPPTWSRDAFDESSSDLALDSFLVRVAGLPDVEVALPHAGQRFGPNDRFEILEVLGQGGMGVVHLVRDLVMDRKCVFKFIRPLSSRPLDEQVAAFEKEARLTAKLKHENIITIHDFGIWQGRVPYLVLEHLRGEPLNEWLAARSAAPLPVDLALTIVDQVTRGLTHAHARGVLHRDLKPANIFIDEHARVTILDFGVAAFDPALRASTQSTMDVSALLEEAQARVVGSPPYMAPEQWLGQADARTDVWAVGVLLYELLIGRRPFDAPDLGTLRHLITAPDPAPSPALVRGDLPPGLVAVVERALAKTPDARFASMRALRQALDAIHEAGVLDAAALPYRGLEPFAEADAPWFFGRDAEATRLQAMLAARPLVALVGAAGAGKTSLVQAGLTPRLRRAPGRWSLVSVRPGRRPLTALSRALERTLGPLPDLDADALLSSPSRLVAALGEHARARDARVLLIIDPLEALFALCPDAAEVDAFLLALVAFLDDPDGPLRLLLCLRDDALPVLSRAPTLAAALVDNTLLLGPPDPDAQRDCLREPARRLDHHIEDAAVAALLDDLSPLRAPLPLLSLVASRLWERRDPAARALRADALDQLGGLEGVLIAHADEALHKLIAVADLQQARDLLVALARPAPTGHDRDALLASASDPARAARVLDHLVNDHLVQPFKTDSGLRLSLSHPALAARWPRLRAWIEAAPTPRRLLIPLLALAALAALMLTMLYGPLTHDPLPTTSHADDPRALITDHDDSASLSINTTDDGGAAPDADGLSSDADGLSSDADDSADDSPDLDADNDAGLRVGDSLSDGASPPDAEDQGDDAGDQGDDTGDQGDGTGDQGDAAATLSCSERLVALWRSSCAQDCANTDAKLRALMDTCSFSRADHGVLKALLECCTRKRYYGTVFEIVDRSLTPFLRTTGVGAQTRDAFIAEVRAMIDANIWSGLMVSLDDADAPASSALRGLAARIDDTTDAFLFIGHGRGDSSSHRHARDAEISRRRATLLIERLRERVRATADAAGHPRLCAEVQPRPLFPDERVTVVQLPHTLGFSSGACAPICLQGFSDCDARTLTGCEVNIANDDSHCGACGAACADGLSCCDWGCADLRLDPSHCGACGVACPSGQTCCAGQCVDPDADRHHCGACGVACANGEVCCDGDCINLRLDPSHCGACGQACGEDEACCSGQCADLLASPDHCDACGRACPPGQVCCSGQCADLSRDDRHCGACHNPCLGNFTCDNRVCKTPLSPGP